MASLLQSSSPCFSIVTDPRRALESVNPVMPFAPVVHVKSVPYNFGISLRHATFSFDTSKKPFGSSATWRPSRAIASYGSGSNRGVFAEADVGVSSEGLANGPQAGLCDLVAADWSEIASPNYCKKLRQKVNSPEEYEDQFIEISIFAATRKPNRKTSTLCFDGHSKPIVLVGPFLINLSVTFYGHPTALTLLSQSFYAGFSDVCF